MAFNRTPFADADMNRFTKTNLMYESNNFGMFQDPTIWSFKIMFIDINKSATGLLNDNEEVAQTAANYLKRIGETGRLNYLQSFTNILQKINLESPWYFQSISGLSDAWKRDFNKPYSPGEITIGCLESVDNRLTTMLDLYRKACFDWNMKREIVPKNLREFEMWVYVLETRRFQSGIFDKIRSIGDLENPAESAKALANSKFLGSIDEDPDFSKMNHILFKFSDCEFSLDSGSKAFDAVSNSTSESISQELTIKYSRCEETNLNTLYGGTDGGGNVYISDYLKGNLEVASFDYVPNGGTLSEIGDLAKATLKKLGENAATGALNAALNKAQSTLQKGLLGNVYGFSPLGAAKKVGGLITNPTSAIGGGVSLGGAGSSVANDQKDDVKKKFGENSISEANDQKDDVSGNVFE